MFSATRTIIMAALALNGVHGAALRDGTGGADDYEIFDNVGLGPTGAEDNMLHGKQLATLMADPPKATPSHSMPPCMKCGTKRPADCKTAARMLKTGCASTCSPDTKKMLRDLLVSHGVCGPQVAERKCAGACGPNCREKRDMHKPDCTQCLNCHLKSTSIEFLTSEVERTEIGATGMTGVTGELGSTGMTGVTDELGSTGMTGAGQDLIPDPGPMASLAQKAGVMLPTGGATGAATGIDESAELTKTMSAIDAGVGGADDGTDRMPACTSDCNTLEWPKDCASAVTLIATCASDCHPADKDEIKSRAKCPAQKIKEATPELESKTFDDEQHLPPCLSFSAAECPPRFCFLKLSSSGSSPGEAECSAIGDLSEPFPVQQIMFTGIAPEMFNTHVIHSLRDEIAEQLGVSVDAVHVKRIGARPLMDVFDSITDPKSTETEEEIKGMCGTYTCGESGDGPCPPCGGDKIKLPNPMIVEAEEEKKKELDALLQDEVVGEIRSGSSSGTERKSLLSIHESSLLRSHIRGELALAEHARVMMRDETAAVDIEFQVESTVDEKEMENRMKAMHSASTKKLLASSVATAAGADPDTLKVVVEDPVSPKQQREAAEPRPPGERRNMDIGSSHAEKAEKTTPIWVYCIFGVLSVSLIALLAMYIHNKSKSTEYYAL